MKGTIRSFVALLTCVACASAAAAQDGNKNVERQSERVLRQRAEIEARREAQRRGAARSEADISEGFSRTVRLLPGGTFDLQNVAGDVSITGGDGREARIEVMKRVRDVVIPRARTAINQVRIDIAERGGNVEVRTFHPRGPSRVAVDYTITLPENTNIILRSTSGNLHVQRMAGDELSANTLTGTVTVRDSRSRMLELHTVVGDMHVHDISAQRALLQSMAGSLEFVGRLMRAGRYEFQTHRGNIRVVPSGDPGFDLEAMTFSGDLRSDFVLKMLAPQAERPAPRSQRVLRGTFGNAGAMVTASSFSGTIEIVKP